MGYLAWRLQRCVCCFLDKTNVYAVIHSHRVLGIG